MLNDLTPGQDYAVKFLTSNGLRFISTPRQLANGNLSFHDPQTDMAWQISSTGYLRKFWNYSRPIDRKHLHPGEGPQWQMIYNHSRGQKIPDDEYMDLAEKISEFVRKSRLKK